MMASLRITACISLFVFQSQPAFTQNQISQITWESIPGNTTLGGAAIGLEANTAITGSLDVTGPIKTSSAIRFADGTAQTSAAQPLGSLTANAGLYSNTIPDFSPPYAYTEVCFKNGGMEFDIHVTGQPTAGGNCLPSDIGWLIERSERNGGADYTWTEARASCLMNGMRLAEPFEWQFSCDNAATLGLLSMTNDREWVSNSAVLEPSFADTPIVVAGIFGLGSCAFYERGLIASINATRSSHEMRCAR